MRKQAHELAETVYQMKGHIKGKTLLPFPEVSIAPLVNIVNMLDNHSRLFCVLCGLSILELSGCNFHLLQNYFDTRRVMT